MTSLQINYWNQQETVRTNKRNEQLRASELNETIRHNQAMESIEWGRIGETHRHNVVSEKQTWFHYETERMDKENWYTVQEKQLAIREAELAVAQQEVAVKAFDVTTDFMLNTVKTFTDIGFRSIETDLDVSKNRREWFNSVTGTLDRFHDNRVQDINTGLNIVKSLLD